MNKTILAAAAAFACCATLSAQQSNDFAGRTLVIHHTDGTTTEIDAATVDYLDFRDGGSVEPADPKVGDYFYSDGTWSDGGLVSINPDGTDPVWAEPRPVPAAGKTVIGIVCCTDQERIAEADKAAGFTHGYVLACKNASDPIERLNGQSFATVRWIVGMPEFEETQVVKSCKSWYQTLNGRQQTEFMLSYFGADAAIKCPAFYYSSTGFLAAPENTSGWFLPSTGQLWDALANFCGNDVAQAMVSWRNISYAVDAGYNDTNPQGPNPLDMFNAVYAPVDPAQKDILAPDDVVHKYATLWTANRYNTEGAGIFNIGIDYSGKNLMEAYLDWFDGDAFARPMLAF